MTGGLSIDTLPDAPRDASLRLRAALLDILANDLRALWVEGGTTFVDRPARPGDLDVAGFIADVTPAERVPRRWQDDPTSRPARIKAAHHAIAVERGIVIDATYVRIEDAHPRRLPSNAFDASQPITMWAIHRAHWLAGQVVVLHGPPPAELVSPPTWRQLRAALDRELEHLERHVAEGDAADPYEATYGIWNGARILRTLATRDPVVSKRSAGTWALEHLPERWHPAIRAAARAYDGHGTSRDQELLREALPAFVAMVREHLPTRHSRAGGPRWS